MQKDLDDLQNGFCGVHGEMRKAPTEAARCKKAKTSLGHMNKDGSFQGPVGFE